MREALESLPEDERVAYTTLQTLVYRLEEKGALRKVRSAMPSSFSRPSTKPNIAAAWYAICSICSAARRDCSVSNLLENGALILRDLKALQSAGRSDKNGRTRGGKHA